jgi:hypothetical protein
MNEYLCVTHIVCHPKLMLTFSDASLDFHFVTQYTQDTQSFGILLHTMNLLHCISFQHFNIILLLHYIQVLISGRVC